MYQPQPPIRRLSAQSIPSTTSTHSSPRTSPPATARGFHPHLHPNHHPLHQHLHQMIAPCRQLHPPKSPLYRPAVLRATDRLARPNNSSNAAAPTPSSSPPASAHADVIGEIKREAFGGDPAFGDADAAAAAVGDLCELVGEEEDADGGKAAVVTGPPCRAHWKPDEDATICDSPACIKRFTFCTRRHHCRRCGGVFCAQHASHALPLNQDNRVHPQGFPSRVCHGCYANYRRYCALRRSASVSSGSTCSSSSSSSSSTSSSLSSAASSTLLGSLPRSALGMGVGIKAAQPRDGGGVGGVGVAGLAGKVGSYVGSVPRDWSWSTF